MASTIQAQKICNSQVLSTQQVNKLCTFPQLCTQTPEIIDVNIENVHPILKKLFKSPVSKVPLAGRIKYFNHNWKKLTRDSKILDRVPGYEIPFLRTPAQNSPLRPCRQRYPGNDKVKGNRESSPRGSTSAACVSGRAKKLRGIVQ